MPVFEDFSENKNQLQSRHEILNEANVERYIKQHGAERTKGYLDALMDIIEELHHCSHKASKETNGAVTMLPRSEADLRKQLLAMRNEKLSVFNRLEEAMNAPKEPNSTSDQTPKIQ